MCDIKSPICEHTVNTVNSSHEERASALFRQGYNCAQAVFAAFCDVTGIDEKTSLRLSSSFGGGMGRMREVCGACSAMFMIAGYLYGYDTSDDSKVKSEHYKLIRDLADKFRELNGTIICRDLLAESKPSVGGEPSERNEHFYSVRPCEKFVADAARIIDGMIAEKQKSNN